MTVPMNHAKRNRTFVRSHGSTLTRAGEELFLVYTYEAKTNKVTSDGPYTNEDEAFEWMRDKLSEGICAWVVSYDG